MALILFPDFGFSVFRRDLSKEAIIEYADKFYYVLNKYYEINKPITYFDQEKLPFPLYEWRNIFQENMGGSGDKLKGHSFYLESKNFHQEWEILFDSRNKWHCFEVGILNESLWTFPPKLDEENVLKDLVYDLVKSEVTDVAFLTIKHIAFQFPVSELIGKSSRLYVQLKLNKIEKICHARILKNPKMFTFKKFHNFLGFIDKIFQDDFKINNLLINEESESKFLAASDLQILSKITEIELEKQLAFLQISNQEWLETP